MAHIVPVRSQERERGEWKRGEERRMEGEGEGEGERRVEGEEREREGGRNERNMIIC